MIKMLNIFIEIVYVYVNDVNKIFKILVDRLV